MMSILGIGIDLVDMRRVERLISQNEDIFRARILGVIERGEIPLAVEKLLRIEAYAHSIAAKEAFLKALGTGLKPGMSWSDVEIADRCSLKPRLAVSGESSRLLSELEAGESHLSFSSPGQAQHNSVQAMVILTKK